jgi:hypothetical protein
MILGLDRYGALHIFDSPADAERQLEAIDVKDDAFEFCDSSGQKYSPLYTRPPKLSKIGPFGVVDIGLFRLSPEGKPDLKQAEDLLERAAHIESASIPGITSIEDLREELRKRR